MTCIRSQIIFRLSSPPFSLSKIGFCCCCSLVCFVMNKKKSFKMMYQRILGQKSQNFKERMDTKEQRKTSYNGKVNAFDSVGTGKSRHKGKIDPVTGVASVTAYILQTSKNLCSELAPDSCARLLLFNLPDTRFTIMHAVFFPGRLTCMNHINSCYFCSPGLTEENYQQETGGRRLNMYSPVLFTYHVDTLNPSVRPPLSSRQTTLYTPHLPLNLRVQEVASIRPLVGWLTVLFAFPTSMLSVNDTFVTTPSSNYYQVAHYYLSISYWDSDQCYVHREAYKAVHSGEQAGRLSLSCPS